MGCGDFWIDEMYTINLASHSFEDILRITAEDCHPPLYHLIFAGFVNLYGNTATIYHLVSVLPYVGILILAITVVYSNFGKYSSLILMCLATLLTSSLYMVQEARMYEMCAFFILLAFLSMGRLYYFIKFNRTVDYIIFIIATLCAAYTHYYGLLIIALLYTLLLLRAVTTKRDQLKKVFIASIIAFIGYLPWIFVFADAFGRLSKDFWISEVLPFNECINYLFSSKISSLLIIIFVFLLFCFLYGNYKKGKKDGLISWIKNMDPESEWTIIGTLTILLTITIAMLVSIFVRPLFVLRYFYPLSIIAWTLFAVCVSTDLFKNVDKYLYKLLPVAISLIIIIPGAVGCTEYIDKEIKEWESTQNILKTTYLEMNNGDTIISDNMHFVGHNTKVSKYYYPNNDTEVIKNTTLPIIDQTKQYWLFLDNKSILPDIEKQLKQQNLICNNELIEGYFAGNYYFYIYKIVPIKN